MNSLEKDNLCILLLLALVITIATYQFEFIYLDTSFEVEFGYLVTGMCIMSIVVATHITVCNTIRWIISKRK